MHFIEQLGSLGSTSLLSTAPASAFQTTVAAVTTPAVAKPPGFDLLGAAGAWLQSQQKSLATGQEAFAAAASAPAPSTFNAMPWALGAVAISAVVLLVLVTRR